MPHKQVFFSKFPGGGPTDPPSQRQRYAHISTARYSSQILTVTTSYSVVDAIHSHLDAHSFISS